MSNISILLNTFHKFTLNGQKQLFKEIRANKTLVDKPFGYIDFAIKMTDNGTIPEFNNSNESAISILKYILCDYLNKINLDKDTKEKFKTTFSILDLSSYKVNNRDKAVYAISKKFNKKKENIINILKSHNINSLVEKINKWEKPEEIHEILKTFDIVNLSKEYYFENSLYFKFYKLYLNIKQRLGLNSKGTINFKENDWKWDIYLDIQKLMLNRSNDKRVRKIENILTHKYNIKYANLYDYENAKKVLKGVQIAAKNNIKLPENIIISPFRKNYEQGTNFGGENTILINANRYFINNEVEINNSDFKPEEKEFLIAYNKFYNTMYYSTLHSEHEVLHEIVHNEKMNCNYDVKVSSMYKDDIDNLSIYAIYSNNNNNNEELRTELKTKQILDGLNENEKELLGILTKK